MDRTISVGSMEDGFLRAPSGSDRPALNRSASHSSSPPDARITGILMEYCPGGDLLNYMGENNAAFDEVCAKFIFGQVVELLTLLHEPESAPDSQTHKAYGAMLPIDEPERWFHGDLKLENLCIAQDGVTVKLIDFQTLQPAARIPREMAHSCGHATRCYEHCHPAAVAAATSALEAHEVWAAGVILFRLLTEGLVPAEWVWKNGGLGEDALDALLPEDHALARTRPGSVRSLLVSIFRPTGTTPSASEVQ